MLSVTVIIMIRVRLPSLSQRSRPPAQADSAADGASPSAMESRVARGRAATRRDKFDVVTGPGAQAVRRDESRGRGLGAARAPGRASVVVMSPPSRLVTQPVTVTQLDSESLNRDRDTRPGHDSVRLPGHCGGIVTAT